MKSRIEIFDNIVQGTPEWIRVRMGVPTASMFKAILAKGEGKTRQSYIYKLAGEIITGEPTESFSNGAMERGHKMEDDARRLYAFLTDTEPTRVGFIRNGMKGCSPDSLIGNDGALEIKTRRSDLQIEALIRNEFLPEHKAQCQGVLWIAEREWIDLETYWPKLPPLIKRAYRDETYIAGLARAVIDFNEELQETVAKVTRFGSPLPVRTAA